MLKRIKEVRKESKNTFQLYDFNIAVEKSGKWAYFLVGFRGNGRV